VTAATLLVAGVLAVLLLPVLSLAVRRRALQRLGGTVEVSLRLTSASPGAGWALGVGRFAGDELQWYRVFSLALRPRRTLSRRDLSICRQRPAEGAERHALLDGAVVMECRSARGPVALAMDPSAVTGFLAWLEARPPGATLPT
jgi:hypothetical protein